MLGERQTLGCAEMEERGVSGLGVVAQCSHCLAAPLEMHRELRGGHGHACGTLTLERGTDFTVELRAGCGCGALVQHLAEERMPERVGELLRSAVMPRTRCGQPQLLARELLTYFRNGRGVTVECIGDRRNAKFDTAHSRCGEQGTLLAAELG